MQKIGIILAVLFLPFFVHSSTAGLTDISLLEKLASSEMEGRGIGTAGLDKARDAIVERLRAIGLQPAFLSRDGKVSSFLQDFRVFTGNELLEGNSFLGRSAPDFIPLAFSRSGKAENAQLVFAGFGITLRPQAGIVEGYDDYEGLDVHGKIVVVMTGDPGTGNRDSIFRNPALYS